MPPKKNMTDEERAEFKARQREYNRRNYLKNRERYRETRAETRDKAKAAAREYLLTLKAETPCTDCGQKFPPICMDFGHLNDKVENLATMMRKGLSLTTIKAEVAKCEIVCSNCHRLRTWSRGQYTTTEALT